MTEGRIELGKQLKKESQLKYQKGGSRGDISLRDSRVCTGEEIKEDV
jgi:hypothetical protein